MLVGAGLLWAVSRGGSPSFVSLTGADGRPLVVRASNVYVVHPSPYESGGRPLVRLHVLGLKVPLDVREDITHVLGLLGRDWVRFEGLGSWFGSSQSSIPVLVDVSRVITADHSGMRRSSDSQQLTDIQLEGDYKIRVLENLQMVSSLLGR